MTVPFPRILLTCIFLLGVYLSIPVVLGGGLRIPGAFAGFAGALLLALNMSRIKGEHALYLFLLVILCLASILAQAFLSPQFVARGHFLEQLMSWALLVYALTAAYGAYLELSAWDRPLIARTFHVILLVLLVGAALEIFTPLRLLSDAFRFAVYDASVYDNDQRDILGYGLVRPKLLTSEPSHLAKFVFLSAAAWLFASQNRSRYLLFYLYTFLAIYLIRSPILLAGLFVPVFMTLSDSGKSRILPLVIVLVAVTLVVMPLAVVVAESTMWPRIEAILEGDDASFIVRIAAPSLLLVQVLADHPILGLGFGAKEAGFDYLRDVYAMFPNRNLREHTIRHLGHNFIFLLMVQMGVVGSAIFGFVFVKLSLSLSRGQFMPVFFCLFCFMNFTGSTNTVRVWSYFFIVFAVSAIVAKDLRQTELHAAPAPRRGLPARPPP